ncbi:MAG: flagellar protein FlaG [Burkholderiales bacterium]|nr:flagellar protein FlaG [Burkholderiales bacterium]
MNLDALSNAVSAIGTGNPRQAQPPARTQQSQVADAQQPSAAVDKEQVQRAAEAIDQKVSAIAPNLRFSVDDDTGKTVVRVVDMSTGETIRQVPSEEVLAISRSIDRLQGLLLNGES